MGVPVRFAAPDPQRQGRGRVSSEMPVRIAQRRTGSKIPEDSPKVAQGPVVTFGRAELNFLSL